MHKRRRISLPKREAGTATEKILAAKTIHAPAGASTVCVSCNRALNTRASCLVLCSRCATEHMCLTWRSDALTRCGSSICFVCSRRCTGTGSSSPTITPSRAALSLTNTNLAMDQDSKAGPMSHKRKKVPDIDQGVGNRVTKGDRDDEQNEESMSGKACGQTFCRECCIEILETYVGILSQWSNLITFAATLLLV